MVAILVAFAMTAFVWRVSQGPFSLGFARDYVQEALSNESKEFTVTFDDIVFSWPELKGPFLLDLTGLRVQKGNGGDAGEGNVLSVEKASVGLSRRALVFGHIRPKSVIINSPSVELVRSEDGRLNVMLGNQSKKSEPKTDENKAPPGEEVAQIFKDMAHHTRGSIFSRLDQFEIRNASVAIRDYSYHLSWYVTGLNFLLEEHPQGVAASIEVPLPGGKEENAQVNVDLVYRKDSEDFRGMTHIRDVNPYVISRFLPVPDFLAGQDLYLTCEIESAFDQNLIPTQMKFSATIPEGDVLIPQEYDAPIPIKDIKVSGEADRDKSVFTLENLSGEIGGVAFAGKGSAIKEDNKFSFPLHMEVAQAELAAIPPLFPKSEHDGEAYEWLGKNIEGGTFKNVAMDMELTAIRTKDEETQAEQWDVDVPTMKLGFDFEGAKVTYNETLMPAENGKGKGMLDLGAETLDITEAEADIGDIHGTDVSVKLTDLMTRGGGYVTINAKLKGPMSTALSYIAAEPIGMDKEEIGIDASNVKGTIAADVTVALPTVKDVPKDAVNVDINGTLTDVNVPGIVNGLPLSGGPMTLATEEGGFRLKGDAQLADRDVKMEWHQYFSSAGRPYSMQVKASVGADQELRNKFGVDLDEYISGTLPVDVVYTLKDGNATVDVNADLNPVRIYIDPFKFEKPVGTPGSLSVRAVLKDDVLKELQNLEIKSKDFAVSNATIGFASINGKSADLYKGTIPSARIGKTQGSLTFQVSNENVMNIDAKAPVFDLAPFLAETEASDVALSPSVPKEKKQRMNIALESPKMLAKNEQVALNTKSYMEMDEDGDITRIEYDAKVGKGNLFVRFKPDATGKRTFRLETNDAGNVLYTFGVYPNVHGGTLIIYGEPKEGNLRGNLHGSMRMENFRVVKAPALASLLSLMSLTGISQLLGNEGLVFSKLESGFEWRFRPEGNLLVIKDGKTSGSSIGLTFSGVLDRGKKTTDIAGTIIPMTEVNSILSAIPLVGDILGGSSGLIAATYTMKGPTSDPKVTVNPLSVLAPGIIRRILFEGGYESKIPDDDERPVPAIPDDMEQKSVAPTPTRSK